MLVLVGLVVVGSLVIDVAPAGLHRWLTLPPPIFTRPRLAEQVKGGVMSYYPYLPHHQACKKELGETGRCLS